MGIKKLVFNNKIFKKSKNVSPLERSETDHVSSSRNSTETNIVFPKRNSGLVSTVFPWRPVVRKTFSTVNWSFWIRFERHFGFSTAIRTGCLVHFSGSAEIRISSEHISVVKSHFCFTFVLVFVNCLK